jgi:hypothetical protein
MARTPTPKADADASVEVRVIAFNGEHAINSVISLTTEEAAAAVAGGWGDDHPEAVAYAKSLASAADEGEANA